MLRRIIRVKKILSDDINTIKKFRQLNFHSLVSIHAENALKMRLLVA